jgi:hypothetical protein
LDIRRSSAAHAERPGHRGYANLAAINGSSFLAQPVHAPHPCQSIGRSVRE